MVNVIFSSVCAVIQLILWWSYEYDLLKNLIIRISKGKHGNSVNKVLKFLVDALPFILLVRYHSPLAIFFLMGCFLSDRLLGMNMIVGEISFLITYTVTSILVTIGYGFNLIYWISAEAFILTAMIVIFIFLKESVGEKIVKAIYGLVSLGSCMVAFLHTLDFGFVCLVIGDILLVIREILKKNGSSSAKFVSCISNSFYFVGVCFVPLVLV